MRHDKHETGPEAEPEMQCSHLTLLQTPASQKGILSFTASFGSHMVLFSFLKTTVKHLPLVKNRNKNQKIPRT